MNRWKGFYSEWQEKGRWGRGHSKMAESVTLALGPYQLHCHVGISQKLLCPTK